MGTPTEKDIQKLVAKLEETARDSHFSGVISVFQGTSALYNRAFGYRDIKNKLPNLTTTRFGIASGTKFITALGIGRLIDQGLITLGTTVAEIDAAYTGFIDPRATILHLLTHTSGIYDYYDEELIEDFDHFFVEIPWYQLETPADYFPLFKNKVMKYHPGERFSYSNGGYVFLGMLIEKLTGRLYRDFIDEQVLRPAQMFHSGFYALNDLPEDTANGYLADRSTTNIYNLPVRGGGDGGLFTTTEDLRSLWASFFEHQILSQELTAEYLRSRHSLNEKSGYGCGIYKRLDDSMVMIVGGDAGVGFDSRYWIADKMTINILSNISEGEHDIRKVILDFLG